LTAHAAASLRSEFEMSSKGDLSGNKACSAKVGRLTLGQPMPRSEYYFRLGMIVAISLLATSTAILIQRFIGLNGTTLLAGPLIAVFAVVWGVKAGINVK
jgi:hypothetical protein